MAAVSTSAAMSIKTHYLEQTLSAFWELVSDENWGLYSDNGEDEIDSEIIKAVRMRYAIRFIVVMKLKS